MTRHLRSLHHLCTLWLVCCGPLAAQEPSTARLYRMVQNGVEVGRETYRRSPSLIERQVVVPVLNLRIDSRAEYAADGGFLRFDARIADATGDSLRAYYRVEARGDSLAVRSGRDTTAPFRMREGRVDGIIPGQSVSIITEAVDRAAGQDTVFRFLPMGGDSVIAIAVRHDGAVITTTLAGLTATMAAADGAVAAIDVPMQRLRAEVWSGRDSLPPLAGLEKPVPDYTAPAGAPFTAEEVRIPMRTAAGDTLSLAGTLTMPAAAQGPVPVVITVSGSGRQTRDEDLWPLLRGYRPFGQIAERLGAAGIGVLRFDDRGVGGSTGGELEATTADHADEVRAIVAWLRARRGVDPRRIALLGHSEGGAIGPLVAERDSTLAALVIMAGPGKTGREILRDQFRWPIETAPGMTDSARADQLARVEEAVDEWAALNSWTRWFDTWDPLPVARAIRRAPVLILHGALDRQVTVGQADTLAAAFRAGGNPDVAVKVYPGLNHLFLPTDGDGSPSEYAALKQVALPDEVLADIVTWLRTRLR